MNFKHIYKIIDKNAWHKAQKKGSYSGSKKDIADGYIHFSAEEQVKETLRKYYSNQADLILLKVETLKLDHLIWEQASDGNMFPHLYSTLDIKNIISDDIINLDNNGLHVLPIDFYIK